MIPEMCSICNAPEHKDLNISIFVHAVHILEIIRELALNLELNLARISLHVLFDWLLLKIILFQLHRLLVVTELAGPLENFRAYILVFGRE